MGEGKGGRAVDGEGEDSASRVSEACISRWRAAPVSGQPPPEQNAPKPKRSKK